MQTIICPTDYSACSINAIRYADEIAQRLDSRIILFHSIHEPAPAYEDFSIDTEAAPESLHGEEVRHLGKLKAIQTYLENTDWGIPISYETRIGYGKAADTIAHVTQQERADLLVLGYEPVQGLKEIFVDSMAASLIRNTTCPVLHIPANTDFKPLHRIVVAVDLQGLSGFDTAFLLKLASLFGAELQLLHVLPKEDREAQAFAFEELQRAGRRLQYEYVSYHVQTSPFVEEGISRFCREQKADMLVVGFKPVNSWQHLFPPTYLQSESTHTYLPVLVLHHK
ncbi:universal stress protein [Rufibacter ruber]|uniref:universal stress protein n=1 Tax=Rufibacter ruber TaxID=1783499 RepID=UPI0008358DE2|nr:universal stress protein [Rufibacter ruber]